MEKYKKLHQRYLHYLLVNRRLSPNEYSVLTSLTEREIQLWFTPIRSKIIQLVTVLGHIVIYQARIKVVADRSWLLSMHCLNQRQTLWSNTLGIEFNSDSMTNMSTLTMGLILLAEHNPRHAMIWAMRLGVSVHASNASVLAVRYPARLRVFIAQVARDASIELSEPSYKPQTKACVNNGSNLD